jgi:hypothetical protein
MASPTSLKRLLWPIVVTLVAGSLLGLECQYEPLPDQRRGFSGDLCRADGTCEPCHQDADGGCVGTLVCAAENPPRCRPQCPLNGGCGSCGPDARCLAVAVGDGGFSDSIGTCSPAPPEGQACAAGSVCAGCLQCATDPSTQQRTCRRTCDSSIDVGPGHNPDAGLPFGVALPGPHPYCGYADLPETGAVILLNCCQFGQLCTPVVEDGQNRNVCFGPLPGQPGSTCKPAAGTVGRCETTGLCDEGDSARNLPNHCIPAGGENQPCRTGSGCDPNLTCISGNTSGVRPICRKNCDTSPGQCPFCGINFDCIPVIMGTVNQGVCVPAVNEAESCDNGQFCSSCLVCGGVVGTANSNKCRRACDPDVDAGTLDAAVLLNPDNPVDKARCPEPADAGTILANCCNMGDVCLRFSLADGGTGNGAACYPR